MKSSAFLVDVLYCYFRSLDSQLSLVYVLDDPEFEFQQEQKSRLAVSRSSLLFSAYRFFFPLGIKQTGREADCSPSIAFVITYRVYRLVLA